MLDWILVFIGFGIIIFMTCIYNDYMVSGRKKILLKCTIVLVQLLIGYRVLYILIKKAFGG